MVRNMLVGTVGAVAAVLVGSATVAYAGPKEDVQAAAKKLGEAASYSWTTTTESGFGTNTQQGKTQKDGPTWVSFSFGDNTWEVVRQGDKAAAKTQDGWKSAQELEQEGGDQPGPGRFMARMVRNVRPPAQQAEETAGKVKDLQKSEDGLAGELTEEGAKDLLSFGGRRAAGGEGPEVKGAKGSVKFWVKDGVLTKMRYTVQGTMSFGGEDREVDRTTTIEIKDVGSTKVEIPAEAQAKLK